MHHKQATEAATALCQAIITFPDVGGGGTASVGTVQINDLDGNPVKRAVVVHLRASASQFGLSAPSGTLDFDTATVGTILEGAGTQTVVCRTDATGALTLECSNSADESQYVFVQQAPVSALAEGILLPEVVSDLITWSA